MAREDREMNIPAKVKIGETLYNVKKVKRVDRSNKNISGQINYGSKEIRLQKYKNNERITQDNFFHEIAHGVLKELEYNHPQISKFRNDETFVQEFGLTLRKTFLDLSKNQKEEK